MNVSVLKSKDQASTAFAKFKAEAENSLGYKIKTVRSDRGGEFLATTFREICEQAGIKRHFTAPYSPQQNGVVERRNRTVMEMSRALLKSMNVPGKLWGEVVRHSVHLLNRLPTKVMGYRTPFEAWSGRRPQLGHMRVFGCTTHVRTANPHLKKLDDRSTPMVYLGVEEGNKAHKLFNPQTKKIVVSRDVMFEEGKAWNWDAAYTEGVEFSVEEIAEPGLSALGYGVGNSANPDDHQHDDSGGVVDSADSDDHQMSNHGELSDHTQHIDNEMENSVDNGTGTLSGTVAG
jgi:hypothetical protein